jgi:AsmA family protein
MNRQSVLLGSICAVTFVLVGGAMAVRTLATPERIREQAQEKVREKWGLDLAIGALHVDSFPWPTVHARDVAVPGFGKAGKVTATLELFPLLFGRVRPSHVLVEGATFDDPKGGNDWRVDRASFDSAFDWHRATMDANISRNGQVAHVAGHFADLSGLGRKGEKTHGKVEIEWGETKVAADGEFRLDGMRGHAVKAALRTESLDDVFAFFGIDRDRTAPLEVTADVRDEGEQIRLDDLHVRLGKLHASGMGTVAMGGEKPVLDAKLAADRLDWKQALVDMGHAQKPREPSEFIFRERKLAWGIFTALRGMRGKVEINIGSMKLGSGVELQEPRASFTFDDDRVQLNVWQSRLLGGTGHGSMRFDGTRKSVHFEGIGESLSLQRWFHERGKDHDFTGGPMQVRMSIDMKGDTWRDLAASVTGPVSIRMGPGVYARQKAGDWEALMAAFSKKDSTGRIDFECAAANLRFESGVARGDSIVGARSTVSRLLTSGVIDMREEHVDLRGKLRTKPDGSVGLSAIANDLQIEGPLRKPRMQLDPANKPATIAKGIAALVTGGLSVLATSAAHSAQADTDPCEIVPARRTDQIASSSVR